MARGGKPVTAGQEVRFLDIPIEAGGRAECGFEMAASQEEAGALAQQLERAAIAHHGMARPAFLAWLVSPGGGRIETSGAGRMCQVGPIARWAGRRGAPPCAAPAGKPWGPHAAAWRALR